MFGVARSMRKTTLSTSCIGLPLAPTTRLYSVAPAIKPALIPPARRTLATTRLTPRAIETAVSVLATRRPRRYLRATVRIVIDGRRPSCGTLAGLGAIELGHVDDTVRSAECGLVV